MITPDIDKAIAILKDAIDEVYRSHTYRAPEVYALAGFASELIYAVEEGVPEPQIVHTIEELEALDQNTVLGAWHEDLEMECIFLEAREWLKEDAIPPLVVVASGEQVRKSERKLEQDEVWQKISGL